jgi:phage shock protein A
MPDEIVPPFDTRLTAEEIRGQIATWANRMAMAKQQGNEELLKQALERKQSYENQLARLQEFEVDDK